MVEGPNDDSPYKPAPFATSNVECPRRNDVRTLTHDLNTAQQKSKIWDRKISLVAKTRVSNSRYELTTGINAVMSRAVCRYLIGSQRCPHRRCMSRQATGPLRQSGNSRRRWAI